MLFTTVPALRFQIARIKLTLLQKKETQFRRERVRLFVISKKDSASGAGACDREDKIKKCVFFVL